MHVKNRLDPVVFDERYPARRVLAVLSNKWVPIALYCLSFGTRRFGELERALPGISSKMLSQVLRGLERDGLVQRTALPSIPPQVEYALTAAGRRIHQPIAALCEWANRNVDLLQAIEANRAAAGTVKPSKNGVDSKR